MSPPAVSLRPVLESDLPHFFQHEQDPVALHMAAFTPKDPADRAAFDAHWRKLLADPDIVNRTILFDDHIAGHIAKFMLEGNPEVTYWIDRAYWNRGIATASLTLFLAEVPHRPLYARAAHDNAASLRVLEKCGFQHHGRGTWFANARNAEIEEVICRLD